MQRREIFVPLSVSWRFSMIFWLCVAAACQPLDAAGSWVGRATLEDEALQVRLELADVDGALAGQAWLGDPDGMLHELGEVRGQRNAMHLELRTVLTEVTIRGELLGSRINGSISFAGDEMMPAVTATLELSKELAP